MTDPSPRGPADDEPAAEADAAAAAPSPEAPADAGGERRGRRRPPAGVAAAASTRPTRPSRGPATDEAQAAAATSWPSRRWQLAERTADLQRLQAEYLNYKRRVDRDRELVARERDVPALAPIIEVLDTIDRAREHGELDGGFKAVADQLERVVAGAGLTKFGEPGDAFDPTIHEALAPHRGGPRGAR